VAGRNAERAHRFAREIGATGACLDTDAPAFRRDLAQRPGLVISTAGPFQGQDYRVALAAIDAGAHYIDIADGRDFVCGIVALDAMAREKGVLVASGASSVPALSAAVVDRLAPEFAAMREIEVGISSSERTPWHRHGAGDPGQLRPADPAMARRGMDPYPWMASAAPP
jgi:saccharopine dehydrogenase-like NADP-dependent oxidoreductase